MLNVGDTERKISEYRRRGHSEGLTDRKDITSSIFPLGEITEFKGGYN